MTTALYDNLIHLGMFKADAETLDRLYAAEPGFMDGLEQMTESYHRNRKPGKYAPTGEPWLMLYATASKNSSTPQAAMNAALAVLDPSVKMALDDAISRMWKRIVDTASKSKVVKTREYISALKGHNYTFRLNECTDDIEVNNEEISDPLRAEIRAKMRDSGYPQVYVMEDAYLSHAYKNRYHPIKEYLDDLSHDGGQHIARLASYFDEEFGVIEMWLRRWLIGAVAKIHEGGQNLMLVLDGPQGVGKSVFAAWLCKSIPEYFIEGAINPEDKDSHVRLMRYFIWEVAELGSTTRKADREALKFFISQRTVTVRKAYGRYDTRKRAQASLIGTFNDEAGLLTDKTGNRRFLVCKVNNIDWSYKTDMNPDDVWAEAQMLYYAGEPWLPTEEEQAEASRINELYEVDDVIEGFFLRDYEVGLPAHVWTSSADIVCVLQEQGLRGVSRSLAMGLGSVCTKLDIKRSRRKDDIGQRTWGYVGVRRRLQVSS